MNIIHLLANDNYITVNKDLIKLLGLEEAVLLGELCSEYNYWLKNDKLENNMFYSTAKNIEENTCLSPYQQRNAIQSLVNAGIIRTELRGIPAVKWFEIDEEQLLKILTTRCEKTSQLDVKKLHSNNNKKNNKENTISKDIVEEKSKKKNQYQKCLDMVNEYTTNSELREKLLESYKLFNENSREVGRPFYSNHFKGKLNALSELATDSATQIKIVEQTLKLGYNSFYELKTDKKRKTGNTAHDIEQLYGGINERADKEHMTYGEKF